jgi:D-alanyl-lipoteichoic acid acyltransferase DltB (MBOAT superfamily)
MFETLLFWVLLLITAASFQITSARQVRARAATLVVASILAIAFVVKLNPVWIVFLISTSIWILVGLKLTSGLARTRPFLASWLVFLPVLLPWVLGKQAVALAWTPLTILYFVGFSFYLIKAWTLIKDYHDGRIEQLDPLVALAYFLFFPAYIAGPMHYFGEFDKTVRRPEGLNGESLIEIVFRILLGLVKIKLVAALVIPVSLEAVKASGRMGLRGLILGSFAYSIVIWADFSGYSDLAIGTSRLVGIQTPENFNYPYAAANIREFWQRWHITFSRVLTAYIFVPISRRLQRAFGERRNLVLIVSYLATFLFCGYWHGPTLNFLLWGLYHGIGLIAYDLYRQVTTRRRLLNKGKPRSRFVAPLTYAVSVVLTFSFVSFGWILFVLPAEMVFKRIVK